MAVGTVDDPCVGDEGVMDMSDGVTECWCDRSECW